MDVTLLDLDRMSSLTNNELDSPPWLRVESTLMATARLVREAFDARLVPLDLNLTQASLIGYVAEFGAAPQTRLADRLGIDLVDVPPDPAEGRVTRADVESKLTAALDESPFLTGRSVL